MKSLRYYSLVSALFLSTAHSELVTSDDLSRQVSDTEGAWSLYLDNDLFSSRDTDRDYTGGLSITYSHRDKSKFVYTPVSLLEKVDDLLGNWTHSDTNDEFTLNSFEFGLTAFTPEEISTDAPIQGDRPYASLTYLSGTQEIVIPEESISWSRTLTIGLLGTSFPGEFQNTVHDATGSEEALGWDNQISEGGEPTFRYSLSRHKHHEVSDERVRLNTTLQVSAGYLTEVSYGGNVRLGKIRSPWWTFNPNQSQYAEKAKPEDVMYQSLDEFYVWLGANIKYRAYNALLQGQFRDSAVTFDYDQLNPVIAEAWLGVTRSFNNGFSLSYVLRAHSSEIREGPADRSQFWGGLIIGFGHA